MLLRVSHHTRYDYSQAVSFAPHLLYLRPRETPLHRGHLRLMDQVSEAGGVILPPVPGFYHRPQSIADLVDHTVTKVLDQLGIHVDLIRRWTGP